MEAEKRRMKEVLKKKWKNKIKVLTAVCLIALLSLGGTLAYLTDYEASGRKLCDSAQRQSVRCQPVEFAGNLGSRGYVCGKGNPEGSGDQKQQ